MIFKLSNLWINNLLFLLPTFLFSRIQTWRPQGYVQDQAGGNEQQMYFHIDADVVWASISEKWVASIQIRKCTILIRAEWLGSELH